MNKETHPKEWLEIHATLLEAAIEEYNEVAESIGHDVILAFNMTLKEREDVLKSGELMEVTPNEDV